jgi:uncharacterized protein
MLKVSQINIYPIKSLAGFSVNSSDVTDRGLKFDRRWMLVDEKNKFLTLREFPKMALLHTALTNTHLVVTSHENPSQQISIPFEVNEKELEEVTIWNATVSAKIVGKHASEWFSDMLGTLCKLVFMPDNSMRPVDTTSGYNPAGKFTSFADAYPFLLLGQASMDDLNSRFSEPHSILRFRPNIVFSGGKAFVEDQIENFKINDVQFTGLENCARCGIPNVNPETGILNLDREPIKTLAKYRNINKNIIFGRNTVHSNIGTINVGDELILN